METLNENDNKLQKDEERGASMLEYGLLAALIAVAAIVAITSLGKEVSKTFSRVSSSVAN